MKQQYIDTVVGKIAVFVLNNNSDKTPVIFLHGVYFDHHLWDKYLNQISDRTLITIDMPLHGESRENIKSGWTIMDCAKMLVEILDVLGVQKVIAIGHSWGSMTVLRAADKFPHRFESVGVCNMPFLAPTSFQKLVIRLQHTMLFFRKFYTSQAAKALFAKESLLLDSSLLNQLEYTMNKLSNRDVQQVDQSVIINADDTMNLIVNLKVKAIALKGIEDYVPNPPQIETLVVGGGHVSPLENFEGVLKLIHQLI
ncbi:MAG: alpha/beta fold hydrolase [Bacteroidota bacterium]